MTQSGKIKGDFFASMEDDLKQFWAALFGALGAAAGAIAQRTGIAGAVEEAMLSPDKILGLSVIAKDAAKLKYIRVSMSTKQLTEIVQVPAPLKSSRGWLRIFSPRSP